MDIRRFDGLARLAAHDRTRRGVLRGLAALLGTGAAGLTGAIGRPAAVRADSDGTDVSVGGSDGTSSTPTSTGACVPVSRPVSALASIRAPFPALITAGTCETPDLDTTLSLFDVTGDDAVGAATAASVVQSVTTVRANLDDLLQQPYSIVVRVSEDDDTVVACGEIGGIRTADDLTVGIRERNASNYTGTAWLRGNDASTTVYLFLGRGLSTVETASAVDGDTVVTTADVNLRAEPSETADIVAVIPEGTELTLTGAARGDWLPVENPDTGDEGFVSAQYLVLGG